MCVLAFVLIFVTIIIWIDIRVKTVKMHKENKRHVYQTKAEDGQRVYVYLLDQAVNIDKIGLISVNLAEKAVS